MDDIFDQIKDAVPEAIGALALLIVGWIVARFVANLVRRALLRTEVDNRVARWITGKEDAEALPVEDWLSKGVYYLILLFVLVGFFEILNLTVITEPLNRLIESAI